MRSERVLRPRAALALAVLLGAALAQAQYCPTLPLQLPPGASTLAPFSADFDAGGASAIVDLRWLGADTGFVLALTSSGRLWRSVTGGRTWADDTPKLAGALDNRGVAAIVALAEPFAARVVLRGHYNASLRTTLLWTTDNHGYSWKSPCALRGSSADCVAAPAAGEASLISLKPHPIAGDTLAAMTRARPCTGYSSQCVLQDVWLSHDFGRSWESSLQRSAQGGDGTRVAGFIDFDWAPETHVAPAAGAQPSMALLATAYLSAADVARGVYFAGYWDKLVHFVLTTDHFATRRVLRRCGNDFRVFGNGRVYLGVASGCDAPPNPATDGWAVTLEVAQASGGEYGFHTACFPLAEAEHGYTLYDIDGADAYIHVDHTDSRDPQRAGQPLGVLYHADAAGQLFSLSRRDVLLQPSGVSDFMPVPAIAGVAFANNIDAAVFDDPAFRTSDKTVYDAVLSRVSRDAGSNWAPLPTPAPLPGQPACAGDACALHIHGPDALWRGALNVSYAGLYAAAGAPGVMWSTGSVGRHLSYAPADVRTFLSNDAGATWATVAADAQIYETGAYGALLVMAPAGPSGPAHHVKFSIDGGACWDTVPLETPMEVHNIQTRPDNAGLLMVMHGILTERRRLGVYVLDFSALLTQLPVCNVGSDIEAWAPEGCHRGVGLIYSRRKTRSRCMTPPSWAPGAPATRPCGCSAADYECAYGYERASGAADGACVVLPDFAIDPGCPDVAASPTRLIAGDMCTGGPPGGSSGGGKRKRSGGPSGAGIFFIVLFVLAFVAVGALFFARLLGLPLPPALRDGVDDAIAAVRGGYGRMKGARPLGSDDEAAWLDGPDASFAPLASSYVPPRS
jgi:hypothetical protein